MKFQKEAWVTFTAEQMFHLVNDVAAYQTFLPWCVESEVLESRPHEMIASMTIAGGGLRKKFTTKNTLTPFREIRMQHLDGPFQHLEGVWTFEDLGQEGCRVQITLQFELKPGLSSMVLGSVFKKATSKLIDAFCQRAQEIYARS